MKPAPKSSPPSSPPLFPSLGNIPSPAVPFSISARFTIPANSTPSTQDFRGTPRTSEPPPYEVDDFFGAGGAARIDSMSYMTYASASSREDA